MSSDRSGEVRADERAIVKEATKRRTAHFANSPRNRPLSKNYEEVGMWGEWEFGRWSGLMPRLEAGGDGGYDFVLPMYMRVDVKTSRRGDALLVEQGKVKADLYVLAKCDEEEVWTGDKETSTVFLATLVGWCLATELLATTAMDTGRGIVNHSVPAAKLRKMEELRKFLTKLR
jgi:hypothetical protein